MLPPSHIHLAEHEHDRDHTAIEHSHWSSHGAASRVSIDDDDGQAIFVDHPGVLGAIRVDITRPAAAVAAILTTIEPEVFARHADRSAGNATRDGPSLDVSTLRGPPRVL
jgi:hypothetical protein